jgi:hypothetical protein
MTEALIGAAFVAEVGDVSDDDTPDRTRKPFGFSRNLGASQVGAAGIPNTIVIGYPTAGRRWEVRRVIIGNTDPFTAGTKLAALFVGAYPSEGITLSDLIAGNLTLPTTLFYSHDQLYVPAGSYLYVVFQPGGSGKEYASAIVHDSADYNPSE